MDELGTGIASSVSAVFANRLMISVRRHYFGHEHDFAESADTTINTIGSRGIHVHTVKTRTTTFIGSTGSATLCDPGTVALTVRREGGEEYEMTDFSEKTGF